MEHDRLRQRVHFIVLYIDRIVWQNVHTLLFHLALVWKEIVCSYICFYRFGNIVCFGTFAATYTLLVKSGL